MGLTLVLLAGVSTATEGEVVARKSGKSHQCAGSAKQPHLDATGPDSLAPLGVFGIFWRSPDASNGAGLHD